MTNRAVVYPSTPKWHFVAALSAATAVHLSAVAIASWHREVSITTPKEFFAVVDVDPETAPPASPQTEVPVQFPPQSSPQEFIEPEPERSPTLKKQAVLPIRKVTQTPSTAAPNARASAQYAPRPNYPYEARSRRITGTGTAMITVNSATGLVEAVAMEESIGHPSLDNATINAFKRWRFKPGTVRNVRVPITFDLTGAHL